MKVLIDRNIEINAITHTTVLAPKKIRWGPHEQTMDVAERRYSPPRPDETFRRAQIPWLATLCKLAEHGALEFYSSDEIMMERFRQKGRPEGYLGINLLRDVPIKRAPSPVPRTWTLGSIGAHGVTEQDQMDFFASVRHPRFLQICRVLGAAHIDDAFHLWTAEEAHLDVLLTMDQRFWRAATQRKEAIASPVEVVTPKELGERLGVEPTDIEKMAAEINPHR
jgi:hypothetical protein